MPGTINGIGTMYYGKRDVQSHEGICENCHRPGTLVSYTTRLWGVVLFVPIIPLGRKRVFDECHACRRHRVTSLHEWEQWQANITREAMERVEANPNDPEVAIDMLGTLAACGRDQQADEYAQNLHEQFADNPTVQFHLGAWYERQGKGQKANACFERALQLDPDDHDAQRAVAIIRIEQGKLDEARELLRFMDSPGPDHDPAVLLMLAASYESASQGEKALELYEVVLQTSPHLGRDRKMRKRIRACEKALSRTESILPPGPSMVKQGLILAGCVTALLIVATVGNMILVNSQKLHVVNGLGQPVELVLDGNKQGTVAPGDRREIRLAEGKHQAVVQREDGKNETINFIIENSILQRIGCSSVFVLNPSGAADILWREAVYREVPRANDGLHRIHFGKSFFTFRDIDYPFKDLPDEVDLDDNKSVSKTTLRVLDWDPIAVASIFPTGTPPARQLEYLEHHLKLDPDNFILLQAYIGFGDFCKMHARCLQFLKSGVDRRPLAVQWHRFYQELAEHNGDQGALIGTYDRLLAENPGDANLLYLRGRIDPGMMRSIEFFDRAIEADPKCTHALNAKAYAMLAQGNAAEAMPLSEKTMQIAPENVDYQKVYHEILLVAKEYKKLERILLGALSKNPTDLEKQRMLLAVLIADGREQDARRANDVFAQAVRDAMPDDPGQLIAKSERALDLQLGRFRSVMQRASSSNESLLSDNDRFALFLEVGETQKAEATLDGMSPLGRAYWNLYCAIGWSRQNKPEKAKSSRESAIAKLKKGTSQQQRLAMLFEAAEPAGIDQLHALALGREEMLVALMTLADCFPAEKATYYKQAALLNIPGPFPYSFFKSIYEQRVANRTKP